MRENIHLKILVYIVIVLDRWLIVGTIDDSFNESINTTKSPSVELLRQQKLDITMKKLNIPMLLKSQLRWVGYISKMGNHHLPSIIQWGEYPFDIHYRWTWKKWFKDCLKKSLVACHIDHRYLSTLAKNHDARWFTTNNVSYFEKMCRAARKNKRLKKKNVAIKP